MRTFATLHLHHVSLCACVNPARRSRKAAATELAHFTYPTAMECSVCYCLLMFLVAPVAMKTIDDVCAYSSYSSYVFDPHYSDLYLRFEKALLKSEALEKLRVAFVSDSDTPLPLDVKIRVVNLTDTPCDGEFISTPTFCLDNTDALCSPLQFTFKSQTLSNLENEESRQEIYNLITWLALLHGSVLSFCMPDNHNLPDSEDKRFELKLTIENWPCNPSLSSTQCVLLELLSWVS